MIFCVSMFIIHILIIDIILTACICVYDLFKYNCQKMTNACPIKASLFNLTQLFVNYQFNHEIQRLIQVYWVN